MAHELGHCLNLEEHDCGGVLDIEQQVFEPPAKAGGKGYTYVPIDSYTPSEAECDRADEFNIDPTVLPPGGGDGTGLGDGLSPGPEIEYPNLCELEDVACVSVGEGEIVGCVGPDGQPMPPEECTQQPPPIRHGDDCDGQTTYYLVCSGNRGDSLARGPYTGLTNIEFDALGRALVSGVLASTTGLEDHRFYLDGSEVGAISTTTGLPTPPNCPGCPPNSGFEAVLDTSGVPSAGHHDLTIWAIEPDLLLSGRSDGVFQVLPNTPPVNEASQVFSDHWKADGFRHYPIWLEASDADGIREIEGGINVQGSNNSNQRGRIAWRQNNYKWPLDRLECTGEGGFVSKAGAAATGHQHITLASCASTTIGDSKVVGVMIEPQPGFDSYVGPNGSGLNDLSIRAFDTLGLNSTWQNFDQDFTVGTVANTDSAIPYHYFNQTSPAGPVSGLEVFAGWSTDASGVATIEYQIDSGPWLQDAWRWVARQDVCAGPTYGPLEDPRCPFIGFSFVVDTTQYSEGFHLVRIRSTDTRGNIATAVRSFTVDNARGGTSVCEDARIDGFSEHSVFEVPCE